MQSSLQRPDCFTEGYSNTGINQIIDQAGIAKSSLYQTFRSKEDLLMAYLELTGVQTITALEDAVAGHRTPRTKMLAIFTYLESMVQQEDFYGCHFLNMVYELPQESGRIRDQVKKQKDSVRRLFVETLIPLGKEELADEIYTLFEGALIGHKVHQELWPIISAGKVVKKII